MANVDNHAKPQLAKIKRRTNLGILIYHMTYMVMFPELHRSNKSDKIQIGWELPAIVQLGI